MPKHAAWAESNEGSMASHKKSGKARQADQRRQELIAFYVQVASTAICAIAAVATAIAALASTIGH